MQNNIVEYFSGHDSYRCGYCKSEDTNYSHGMWAHGLAPADYENLLNRGWRRSGKYLYKPTNSKTCCPCYTISCLVRNFGLSRSQKKVLKKFNHYLLTGDIKSSSRVTEKTNVNYVQDVINYQPGIASCADLNVVDRSQLGDGANPGSQVEVGLAKRRKGEPSNTASTIPLPLPGSSRPAESSVPVVPLYPSGRARGQKSKAKRIERKIAKWISQGLNPEDELANRRRKAAPKIKSLEEFIHPNPHMSKKPPPPQHHLEIRLVKVDTPEFQKTFELEYALYCKYQRTIHGDDEDDCSSKQFKRFLVDNPLNENSDDDTGAYHQQYYLDGVLIAVAVVDLLPTCLSSVYFFYDPAYSNLTLGTVGALREIAFVRERSKSQADFQFYYMGFYIHSCPKMRYKGNFTPSYLLCPETYKWRRLDEALGKDLDKEKYIAFCASGGVQQPPAPAHESINRILILYRRSIMPYGIYKLQRAKDDTAELQEYVDLVGVDIASNLCLYRSLG